MVVVCLVVHSVLLCFFSSIFLPMSGCGMERRICNFTVQVCGQIMDCQVDDYGKE